MKLRYIAMVAALMTAVFVVGYLDKPPTHEQQVYSACMKARSEYNMFSENYCASLQDQYKLKLYCSEEGCLPKGLCNEQ